jgi:hypothetical protein
VSHSLALGEATALLGSESQGKVPEWQALNGPVGVLPDPQSLQIRDLDRITLVKSANGQGLTFAVSVSPSPEFFAGEQSSYLKFSISSLCA